MLPESFPPAPRVVIVCRSRAAAMTAIAGGTRIARDHPALRYAQEPRDLVGCTAFMAFVDLSSIRGSSSKTQRPMVHLPYGRTGGGETFDGYAARALATLSAARRIGMRQITLAEIESQIEDRRCRPA